MTISMVQSAGQASGTPFTFASNITVGNTLFLVLGEYDNSTTETITNVKVGTTSVTAKTLLFPQINVADAQGLAIVMIPNVQVSGQKTISYTYSGTNVIATWACEVSGLGANPVVNQSSPGSGNNNTIASGTTPASTVANAFALGGGATYNGSTSTPSGTTWANTDLGINSHLSIGWEIQTTIGQTYNFTQATGGDLGWAAGVVVVAPGPALAQATVLGQGQDDTSQAMAISTTAGNAYVATFAAWQTSTTPFAISSVTDTAGNTWNYSLQSGAYDTSQGAYSVSGIAWCLPSMQGTGKSTKAVTGITVNWGTTITDWGECVALEIANLPSTAVALAQASTTTLAAATTSYTFPSINPTTTPAGGNVVVVATSSSFGEITAESTGYTAIVGSDTIGVYNLNAATGSAIAPSITQTVQDVPTAQTVAFGVGTAAAVGLTGSATLSVTPTFTAGRVHGRTRGATLSVTPAISAGRTRGRTRGGTSSIVPSFLGGRVRGRTRSASQGVAPTLSAGRVRGRVRGATRGETPTFSAGRDHGRFSHAILSLVPSFIARRLQVHGRSATRSETPTIAATGVRGHTRHGTEAVTPTTHATAVRGHTRSGARGETPTITAGAVRGHTRHATLSLTPTFTAGATGGAAGARTASATLSITATFHATGLRGHTRSAALSVSPAPVAGRARGRVRSAVRSLTPSFAAGRLHGHARGAARSAAPALTATAVAKRTRGASLAVSPSFSAGRVRGWVRGALAHVIPTFRASGTVTPGGPVTLTFSVPSECDVYVGFTLSVAVTCDVGAAYQAGMRSLAQDRWIPMYPYSKGAS